MLDAPQPSTPNPGRAAKVEHPQVRRFAGDLVLVDLSDAGTPRDVYVDGHFVTTVPYSGQIVVAAAAGVVHTVEWVSTISGHTRDVTKVVVDECTPTTLTNHF
jgi:hypothetical protein